MIDYHVHTLLCNHARGTMEQYIARAIELGLKEICFLDHLTLNEKGRDLSMGARDVPLYYYAVQRFKAAYGHQIRIKVGLEVDYTPEFADTIQTIADRLDFDVIGGSIHFLDERNLVSSKTAANQSFEPDDAFYDRYLAQLDRMLDHPYIDMICHFDVLKKFGTSPPDWFYEKAGEILDKIRYTNKVLEINTSGLTHAAGAVYPDARILKKCREKGIPVCLGSDAHRPEQVGQNFDAAIDLLKNAGYTQITGFDRKTPYGISMPTPTGGAA